MENKKKKIIIKAKKHHLLDVKQPQIEETIQAVCKPMKYFDHGTFVNYELWDRKLGVNKFGSRECFDLHNVDYFPGQSKAKEFNKKSYSVHVDIFRDEQAKNPYAEVSIIDEKHILTVGPNQQSPDGKHMFKSCKRMTNGEYERYKSACSVLSSAVHKLSKQTIHPELFKEYYQIFCHHGLEQQPGYEPK